MLKLLLRMLRSKVASNALWIVICKGLQAVLGVIISVISARILGPVNYGLVNYAASLVLFVTPVAQLGMAATLVHEVVSCPDADHEGRVMGTAIISSLVSSVLCILGILLFVSVSNPNEPETLVVCGLYSLLLLSQGAELIQYWFQAKLLSKYTAIITLIAYVLISAYQIVILAAGRGVNWFAIAKAAEYAMIAVALLIIFHRKSQCKPSFSGSVLRNMWSRSWYYMLSNLMVMSFSQADRIMIKTMIDEAAVGFYSAAVVGANATDFLFFAIIDSMRPIILEAKKKDEHTYERNMTLLYSIVVYLSLIQSVVIAVFAKPVVYVLHGSAYSPSVPVLKILVWYTAFSYLGTARNVWILAEGKHKLLWKINLCGAVVNIFLNWRLIPLYGISGAAFASLITQATVNVGIGFVMPSLRANNHLLMRSLNPKTILHGLQRRC